jgi:hypothetical protein
MYVLKKQLLQLQDRQYRPSSLHIKEGPTKSDDNKVNLVHYLQTTSRIYRVHLSLQKETKRN